MKFVNFIVPKICTYNKSTYLATYVTNQLCYFTYISIVSHEWNKTSYVAKESRITVTHTHWKNAVDI